MRLLPACRLFLLLHPLVLLFFGPAVRPVSALQEAGIPVPAKAILVHECQDLHVGKTVYADAAGKPQLDRPVAEFSGREVVKPGSNEPACGDCFEGVGDPFGCESRPYVFADLMINGRRYVKVRFNNEWAWLVVLQAFADSSIFELTEEQRACYVERQHERAGGENLPELLTVNIGTPFTIIEKLSVRKGRWTKRLQLASPGMLDVSLPAGSETFYFRLTPAPPSCGDDECSYNLNEVLNGAAHLRLSLPAGVYHIALENLFEGDALPACPSVKQALNIVQTPLPPHLQELLSGASLLAEQELVLGPEPHEYHTIFSRVLPGRVTLSRKLDTIALIRIENVNRGPGTGIDVRYGDSDYLELAGDRQILAGPGEFQITLSYDKPDTLSLTEPVLAAAFSISALFAPEKTSALLLPDAESSFNSPGELLLPRIALRNTSGLDLKDVLLAFKFRGLEEQQRLVPLWKHGEVQTFDFFLQRFGYSTGLDVSLEVMSAHGATEIQYSLAHPKFQLFEHKPELAASPEYEQQIKLPVFRYCTKTYPDYGERFQECQDRWLREEYLCRRVTDSLGTALISCVRDGIAKRFPELLPHLNASQR